MAPLVGDFPTDFFTNLATGVRAVRPWIPKVAHVLDPIALLVVGNSPAYCVDKGHVSSVSERDFRHDHVEDLGGEAGDGCHEARPEAKAGC